MDEATPDLRSSVFTNATLLRLELFIVKPPWQ